MVETFKFWFIGSSARCQKEGPDVQNNDLLLFCLTWISVNTPSLVQLLGALVPVMALAVAGYALHVTNRKGGRK